MFYIGDRACVDFALNNSDRLISTEISNNIAVNKEIIFTIIINYINLKLQSWGSSLKIFGGNGQKQSSYLIFCFHFIFLF